MVTYGRLSATLPTVLVTSLLLVACQANPGDAPTVDDPVEDTAVAESDSDPAEDGPETGDGSPTPVPEEYRTIEVGVDSVPADLNPHLVGSQSMLTSMVGELTLPSAFGIGPDGSRTVPNSALLDSVDVLEGEEDAPTEVRYTIADRAQWSDGTPISGSDFDYLHRQITSAPGALETSVYSAVDDLEVSAGGTRITVTFDRPTEDWRELFAHLLPSHIYGAENRPFASMMGEVPAASGGIYTVRQFNPGRGTLVLERNARYGGENPARTDELVFSTAGDVDTSAQMLRADQLQMLTTRNGAVTSENLASVPGVSTRTVGLDNALTLSLNTASERLEEPGARREVLSSVDTDRVARLVTGHPRATAPSGDAAAGGTGVEGTDATGLRGVTGGRPLRIAADTLDDDAVEAARRVADSLVDEGIPATAVAPSSSDLYSSFLPRGEVDAVVSWQGEARTWSDLRSRYACDREDRPVTDPSEELPTETETAGPGPSTTAPSDTAPSESASASSPASSAGDGTADGELSARAANVSGICDDELDGLLAEGGGALDGVPDGVAARLGDLQLSLPLASDRIVVATTGDITGPAGTLDEWPMGERTGPFVSAGEWRREGAGDDGETTSPGTSPETAGPGAATDTTGSDPDDTKVPEEDSNE